MNSAVGVAVITFGVMVLIVVGYWRFLRRAGWRPGWRPGDAEGWGMRRYSPLSFAIATALVGVALLVMVVVVAL